MGKFYTTTPIFYPNARPHLGNLYPTVLADVLARYHRLIGDATHFLTGTDENTQKMVDSATKLHREPMAFLDETVQQFKKTFNDFGISYDQFIRTTDQRVHWPGSTALWKELVASGDIYKKEYEGLYCVGHEAFVTEKELVNGKCPDHDTEPQHLKEENYFFRLSKYTSQIKGKIESGELLVLPETRRNEIVSLLNEGLEDVSFSRPRRANWPESLGVPVPGDPSQIMYVWCDALANYATAVGYGRDKEGFARWWPADVHVIGKDILRFHAAIWPAMLLSAGMQLPRVILAHGLILSGGRKMSKTLGNVIDPIVLAEKYGAEAVRYYLLRHISPFTDGDMTEEGFNDAYNGNLANGLGNLVARVMKLAEDNLDAPVAVRNHAFPKGVSDALDAFEFTKAMDVVWAEIQALDQRINAEAPFKLIKIHPEAGKHLITELVQRLALLSYMIAPFMPETAEKIGIAVRTNTKPESLFKRIEP